MFLDALPLSYTGIINPETRVSGQDEKMDGPPSHTIERKYL